MKSGLPSERRRSARRARRAARHRPARVRARDAAAGCKVVSSSDVAPAHQSGCASRQRGPRRRDDEPALRASRPRRPGTRGGHRRPSGRPRPARRPGRPPARASSASSHAAKRLRARRAAPSRRGRNDREDLSTSTSPRAGGVPAAASRCSSVARRPPPRPRESCATGSNGASDVRPERVLADGHSARRARRIPRRVSSCPRPAGRRSSRRRGLPVPRGASASSVASSASRPSSGARSAPIAVSRDVSARTPTPAGRAPARLSLQLERRASSNSIAAATASAVVSPTRLRPAPPPPAAAPRR